MGIARRNLLRGGIAASAVALTQSIGAKSNVRNANQPNIIFIMADDLGYADLGCYGARTIRTPFIDSLARDGLRLTDGYANSPVCSATRTALMTGRYQYRLPCGLEEPLGPMSQTGLPADELTLPKMLRDLGHATTLVGKWHLGASPDHSPLKCGYDRFFGIEAGSADYFTHKSMSLPPPASVPGGAGARLGGVDSPVKPMGNMGQGLVDGTVPVETLGYLTDILGDRAVAEIKIAAAAAKPFFLSLHFTAPHWPWEGPEDEEASKLITDQIHADGGNLATYAKMVENMDSNVGKVLDALARLKIAGNTIIVFTSDNGGERFSDVWPFTGAKTELLEGGIRVPLIICWPAKLGRGKSSAQMMTTMDFAPTFVAVAGGNPDSARSDGENLLPVLLGLRTAYPRKLYWRYHANDQAALREGNWKFLRLRGREYLFDLSKDNHERANLAQRHAERLAAMKQDWEDWNATMLAYAPTNASIDIADKIADR